MIEMKTRTFRVATLSAALSAVLVAGCSSGGPSLTTSSLFGGSTPAAADASAQPAGSAAPVVAAPPPATPVQRAFHVGTISARAQRCGYNFDPSKVKSSYFATEQSSGVAPDQLATLEKAYSVAFNGVIKAATEDPEYCSPQKTQTIKADLAKLLASDFNPPVKQQQVAKANDEGLFGGLFSGSTSESGPAYGSSDWWDKQAEKVGH